MMRKPYLIFALTLVWLWPLQPAAQERAPQAAPGFNPQVAQERGTVRIQGRDNLGDDGPVAPGQEVLLDHPEEMRAFIQNISDYARKLKPNFVVMPLNAQDLLIKNPEEEEENRLAPARTFMKAIDGMVVEGLFYGERKIDRPRNKERLTALLKLIEVAQRSRLRIMVVDYAKSRKIVDQSYKANAKKGFVSFAANAHGLDLAAIPPYPRRPINENPKSVLSLKDVKNFLYLRESLRFGRQDEFAMKMHDTNYDMVIVDVFHGRKPLSKRAVETLKYKKTGGRRLVLAYMNIGTAASYDFYWKKEWREGSPRWINTPLRDDPDRYYVEYWNPEWQKVITGNPKSFLYGIVRQGFDGVLIDGIKAAKYFSGGGEDEEEDSNQ